MIISILTDTPNSWFIPYATRLEHKLSEYGHKVICIKSMRDILNGDVCFLLSCSKIVGLKYLERNKHNIVVHASDLPKGRGFSPIQWQIQEGSDDLVLTLFEAIAELDAGPFYIKDTIHLCGTELLDEIRDIAGKKIIEMCSIFIKEYDKLMPIKQIGNPTFYPKRTDNDDEIDPQKTIIELMNRFRSCDIRQHPNYFYYKGVKFYITLQKGI